MSNDMLDNETYVDIGEEIQQDTTSTFTMSNFDSKSVISEESLPIWEMDREIDLI